MKFSYLAKAFFLLTITLLIGCQSPRDARIQANAAAFAELDPFTQNLIKQGLFDLGFTRDQVFMALGKPNKATSVETPEGLSETWVFKNFIAGDARNVKFGASSPAQRGPVRAGTNPTAAAGRNTAAVSKPGEPGIDDMVGPALATLYLDLLNGRVISARIEG